MRFFRDVLLGAVLASVCCGGPVLADPKDLCSCDTLESLQQEYQNAVFLEGFFRSLSGELLAWETNEAAEKAKGLSSVNIVATSSAMLKARAEGDLPLPFPKVKGYKGPERVSMTVGTCKQPKEELDALRDGSPCFGIAEAVLAHEIKHQEICNSMGAAAYWDRPGSVKAIEEADRYKAQAAAMQAEINRVLARAEVTVIGEWPYTVTMQGMEMGYAFEFASGDMNPASLDVPDGEFSATGKTSHTLKTMNVQGLSCTGKGTVFHDFNVKLKTNGLVFALEFDGQLGGGEHSVTCQGATVPMPPAEGSGWGQFNMAGLPLAAGETKLPTKWTDALMPMGGSGLMGMMSGISVTGEAKSTLTISCPKP